jgi:hypothetical protein
MRPPSMRNFERSLAPLSVLIRAEATLSTPFSEGCVIQEQFPQNTSTRPRILMRKDRLAEASSAPWARTPGNVPLRRPRLIGCVSPFTRIAFDVGALIQLHVILQRALQDERLSLIHHCVESDPVHALSARAVCLGAVRRATSTARTGRGRRCEPANRNRVPRAACAKR